eukprot:Polyplicarium_translucidae@DN1877_c0_g1_i1.p1
MNWISPPAEPHPETSCSASRFIPDALINPHPRFATLVRNIRRRRGAKIFILAPLYKDSRTEKTKDAVFSMARPLSDVDRFCCDRLSRRTPNPVEGHIYMDTFAFGMGMSCVQMTYLSPTISEARWLYDQFAVLSPLWLSLTASAPYFRGMLAATDSRWDVLSQSVDCRTVSEMTSILKSRFASISMYISDDPVLEKHSEEYNDLEVKIDEAAMEKLVDAGVDRALAKHIAYLWIRDPMVIFSDRMFLRDETSTEHFENIQSTNWNSVRFKPPPPSSDGTQISPIGWRVEFRTPDIQLTDFENAASCALLTVIRLAILRYRLDLYIPITKLDENFARSTKVDAIDKQLFWFRNDVRYATEDRSISRMSLHEIFFGTADARFPGMVHYCRTFMCEEISSGAASEAAAEKFLEYADFIAMRTSGKLKTNARFLRDFVRQHPDYNKDSQISGTINFDLSKLTVQVGNGEELPEALFGPFVPSMAASMQKARASFEPLAGSVSGLSAASTTSSANKGKQDAGRQLRLWCRRQELPTPPSRDWGTFCNEWCGVGRKRNAELESTTAATGDDSIGDCRLCAKCKAALLAESDAMRKACCESP